MNNYEYLLKDINTIKGIGSKTSKLFRKKNINTIFDLLWSAPHNSVDRTNLVKIKELQIIKKMRIVFNILQCCLSILKNNNVVAASTPNTFANMMI